MNINSYDKLVAVLTLQKKNLSTYQTEVGATAADITDVAAQLECLLFMKTRSETVDADKKAVFGIKQQCYNGNVNEEVAELPVFATDAAPPMFSGILQLTIERNKRFKLGPGYTNEIGIALGIASPAGDDALDPSTVQPTLDLFAAATGNMFTIVISNRGDSDQSEVIIQRAVDHATFEKYITGKSSDIHITPATPGQPEQLLVRVQLKRNNENYGIISDPVYVTLNP